MIKVGWLTGKILPHVINFKKDTIARHTSLLSKNTKNTELFE